MKPSIEKNAADRMPLIILLQSYESALLPQPKLGMPKTETKDSEAS